MVKNIKERYLMLLAAIENRSEDKKEDLEFVNERMLRFGEYIASIYRQQVELASITVRLSDENIPNAVMDLDGKRHRLHNAAIDGIHQLNRLCRRLETPVLFDGDEDNRQAVAEFCMEAVQAFFDARNIQRK